MKPNKERLQQLHDMLDNVADDEFNIACFTTCTIGHGVRAGLIPEFTFIHGTLVHTTNGIPTSSFDEIAEVFGLSTNQFQTAFWCPKTRTEAQTRLKELLDVA